MNENELDKSEVMQHLMQYNEQELFYREYAALQTDEKALNLFLNQYNSHDLWKKRIYINGMLPNDREMFAPETAMWDNQDDIYIEKYCRFMPHHEAVHDYFEIVYVVENAMDINLGEKIITLKSGDVCFISPGILHSPSVMEKTIALQMIVRKSTFHQEFFRCLTGNSVISDFFLNALYLQNDGSVLVFHMNSDEEIKNIFFTIYQENYNKHARYQIIINSLFEILLCHLLRCDSSNTEIMQIGQEADSRMTQILQYIESNCKTITISDLSKEFHLSGPYLSKYITSKTGNSFSSILQEIRLEKARNMLCSSNLKVEDIADAVGYHNVEHFIRLFKHKYSKTPGQFRKGK
jgi:AraC-like DNA-binding protein/mannose-6-phosphate isomerase-like protein (cupin superfamily)